MYSHRPHSCLIESNAIKLQDFLTYYHRALRKGLIAMPSILDFQSVALSTIRIDRPKLDFSGRALYVEGAMSILIWFITKMHILYIGSSKASLQAM